MADNPLNFDFDEFAAQVVTVQPKKAWVNPSAGKVRIKYSKLGQRFELTDPEDFGKPEDKQRTIKKRKLRGVIMNPAFDLGVWGGGKRRVCRMTSYTSKLIDPETGNRKEVQGKLLVPGPNKWRTIGNFSPSARRTLITEGADGKTQYNNIDYDCTTCMNENEDEWFKKCKQEGSIDFIVFEIDDEVLDTPFIATLNAPQNSADSYQEYIQILINKWNIKAPQDVYTELSVKEGKRGAYTFDLLNFEPVRTTEAKEIAIVTNLYSELETKTGGTTTPATTTKAPSKGKPASKKVEPVNEEDQEESPF